MAAKLDRLLAPLWELTANTLRVGVRKRKSLTDKWEPTGPELVIPLGKVPDEFTDAEGNTYNLKAYGLQKLLQERASQQDDPHLKVKELTELWDGALSQGKWSLPRKNADRKDYTYTIMAIAEASRISFALAKASFDPLPVDVKAKFVDMYKEQAAKLAAPAEAIDLSSLLN